MLELENQLEAIAAPPPEPIISGLGEEEDAKEIQGEFGVESGPDHSSSAWKIQPKEVGMFVIKF
jgi:hypothetical protein